MAGIIVTRNTVGLDANTNASIGKISTPLKMYVISEAKKYEELDGPAKWLCNLETSNRFAESAVCEARTSGLEMVSEGDKPTIKGHREMDSSTVEHFQYMTREVITASEVEDSHGSVTGNMRRATRRLCSDYATMRNRLAVYMLANGTKTSYTMSNGMVLPLPAPGAKALFCNDHAVGLDGDTHSNLYYNTRAANTDIDYEMMTDIMGYASSYLRSFPTNDGGTTGFNANTVIIPGNVPKLEKAVKKAIGSEYSDNGSGAASNGINIQHGNWNLVILTDWVVTDSRCPMIFMSSDAREQLGGNMLYLRTKYTIRDWVDNETWNYNWGARCRLGIGHHTWKHALLFESLANGTTTLYDGSTAANVATSVTL